MGIYDRDYMREDPQPYGGGGSQWGGHGQQSFRPHLRFPVTLVLIGINVLVFFLWRTALSEAGSGRLALVMRSNFLVSLESLRGLRVWTLVTSAFSHVQFGHLLFNMLPLFFFGRQIEILYGKAEYVTLYVVCAVISGLAHSVISPAPALGASGSVMGILILYACLFPNRRVYVQFIIPVQIKYLAIFWVVTDLIGAFNPGSGVAHAAHLGGALMGFLYWKYKLRLYGTIRALVVGRERPPQDWGGF